MTSRGSRVGLTSREYIIALDPLEKGLMGTLLRYPYEVRDEKEYFDEIQDMKVTKDIHSQARKRKLRENPDIAIRLGCISRSDPTGLGTRFADNSINGLECKNVASIQDDARASVDRKSR